jgi:hypothetical protein
MYDEPDLGAVALFLLLKHSMLEFKQVVGSTFLCSANIGSLLTRVKQNYRDRSHARAQAKPAGVATQEVGARATTRSTSA